MRLLYRINDNFFLIILFFIFLAICVKRNHSNLQGVIWSDTEGYYMYLPAVFIYKNVHQVPERSMNGRKNEKGEIVMKYTCGVAFFYLPFFLMANAWANLFHYNTSGFSEPYYYGMILCGVFWAFTGLYFLKTLLLKYFDPATTWVTLLCIILGTNFFHYSTKYIGMSHIYSFALVAAILLLTHYYYENPTKRKAILMSLLMGWLILTRPTNCILIIFVLLYKVASINDLKQRVKFFKNHVSDIAIAIPFLIVPIIPQMLYWKAVWGKWIVYSYKEEGFIYWKHPKIFAVLFDTQNGLFLYSPVLLLMFWGLLAGRKERRTNFAGVSILFVIATYLFASWWAWWFGAAFGHRSYIEYYPLLAFPMAIAIEKMFALKIYLKVPVALILVLFCYYSVRMSLLFDTTGIWDGPYWRWNWDAWAQLVKQIF